MSARDLFSDVLKVLGPTSKWFVGFNFLGL